MHDRESALSVLRSAIQNEVAGQRYYADASFYCIDTRAKGLFATLADEEEAHLRLLLAEYEALAAYGRWIDREAAQHTSAALDLTQHTFPEQDGAEELFPAGQLQGDNLDRRGDDLAALAHGIDMESKAIDLYRRSAAATSDATALEAYRFLLEEETRHRHQILEKWERQASRPFGRP